MDDDIEMDDDQEQEQELEPEYDDDDVDQDDASDDMDGSDPDADDDEDDDASEAASASAASASASPSRSGRDEALSSATFLRKVHERRSLFRPPPTYIATTLGYQIEPLAAAPHSTHIHATALSLDSTTLLTAGADAYVRKYDLHSTMNGKSMLTQNVRHGFVEGITRGGTLTAFWAHEEHLPTSSSALGLTPQGGAEKDRLVGVVHSLAIQQDALWGLSGSESGNVHLYGVRHDPGVTRHVFRKHKGPVSALAVMQDDAGMVSGGWDRGVHQWDLNTGQVVRSFPGFAGQISSLAFRPHSDWEGRLGDGVNVAIHPEAAGGEVDEDEEDKARNEDVAEKGDMEDQEGEKLANGDAEEEQPTIKEEAQEDDSEAPIAASTSKDAANGASPNGVSASTEQTAVSAATPSDGKEMDAARSDKTGSNGAATDKDAPSPTSATGKVDDEKDAADTPTKQSSTTLGSTTIAGDDPTDEELAFEAELNASLGMALDGSGGAIKADGTRPDSVTAGASGTTAGGLMVAGADLDHDGDDDDLFGGDTPPASSTSAVKDKDANAGKSEPNGAGGNDSDGDDSLFGDGDEDGDGDADADGDAEMDADGDAEADADGDEDDDKDENSSDEDMPLAGRTMAKNPSSQSTLVAQGTASPALSSAPMVPSASATTDTPLAAAAAKDIKPDVQSSPSKPSSPPKKALPKPAFGGFSIASSFDAPLSTFSKDVMLTTSLSGQVILWDLRCPTYTSPDGPAKGVHSLALPSKVPPWCQQAIFNSTGDRVFVGRKNESVDEWDLRMPSAARYVRSLRLPTGSGPVYSLAAMPNRRHIITGSYDNIRLWDTEFAPGPGAAGELKVPFKIVAGHHGASLSSVLVDASCKFLISASGDRGWMGSSTEAVIIHDIKALI
ncbi:WD40 repeat [Kalmanozyma brasiliensis GHG001]|uniref:Transcription factor spt8 beta-propeller domain-containing protein n=1 Tax=Kalmanozyma brasiliensis (strain GHG001) TaxID=1365824 RepID=V5EF13_KALBG|nr:WD40 repeat [Kalmanozyma brasiliensis GHG001]EST09056.1 WD40 repeat [Kalmanozyma brasiliensis GHG001]